MCGTDTCPVHTRTDVREDVTDQFGSGRAITYVDDYCVVTTDNPDYSDPASMLLSALAGVQYVVPGMFMTVVVKVGDKAVGDLSDAELSAAIVHREDFVQHKDSDLDPYRGITPEAPVDKDLMDAFSDMLTEKLHENHDQAVLGVQSGLIS